MSAEELLSRTRKHLWAAWALSSEEIGSQAAATLLGLGMLVPEGGAAELESLRARVAGLEAERDRRRARLVALQNDQLDMRGSLSPNGEKRKVPFPLGETLTPAVDWLIARVAELEAERHETNQALSDAAEALRAARDRIAELERPAVEAKRNEIRDSFAELTAQAEQDRDYEGAFNVQCQLREREEQWRREDPHESPLHHEFRLGRDLPETGGAR